MKLRVIALVVTLVLTTTQALLSQSLSQTNFDLGKVSRTNEDVVELNIANPSSEDIYLLRIEAARPIDVKYTSKSIPPNSASLLRIKLNPTSKGRSNSTVKLYFSHLKEAVELDFSMNVKELPRNNLQACPSFNSNDMAQKSLAAFNRQKRAKIKRFYVSLGASEELQESIPEQKREDNQLAEEAQPKRLDYPSIEEMRKAQTNQEEEPKGALHNRQKRTKKDRLSPEERRNAPSLGQILFGNEEEEKTESDIEEEKETEQVDQAEEVIETPEQDENRKEEKQRINKPLEENTVSPNENLLDDSYKANNVIFLIDASNSMNNNDKMALLQKAMTDLLTPLRSIDYLSIVTYAGNARVLLQPTSAIEKDSIEKSIFNIQAEGSTQAVKGLNTAIDVGLSNFIEGGNNQIILATDGAFDIGERNTRLRERIEETAQKGLKITVVGIQSERHTKSSLKEIASLGDSEFIRIKNKNQSKKLLEFVKESALITD